MKYFKTKMLTVIVSYVFITACSSAETIIEEQLNSGNCGSGDWTTFVEQELNEWITATQNYAVSQSVSNCEAFKSKGLDYIEALENARDCIPTANLNEYQEELDNATVELSQFSCQ